MAGRLLGESGHKGFNFNQLLDFEAGLITGLPNAFDSVAGGDTSTLTATAAAALRGSFGASVGIPGDLATRFGQITGPNAEKLLTLQFLFDPNSIVMALADLFNFILISDSNPGTAFRLNFTNNAGVYNFNPIATNDAGGNVFGAAFVIPDRVVQIRIELKFSSEIGADDGFIKHYVDGEPETFMMNIDNDTRDANEINVGAISGVDAGTNGTLFLDNIEWANKLI